MKTTKKIAIVLVSLYICGVIFAIWAESYLIIGGMTSALLILLPPLYDVESKEGRNRFSAVYRAYIPGWGHIYMGERIRSIPFFIGDMLVAFTFLLIIPFPNYVYLIFASLGVLFTYLAFVSLIDVERLCNAAEFQHNQFIEMGIKRFHLAFFMAGLTTYAAMLAFIAIILQFCWTEDMSIYVYAGVVIVSTMALTISTIVYMKHRRYDT